MAYNKDKIFERSLSVIKEHNLYFIEDVVAYLPCSKETFYTFFPVESDKFDAIKDELEKNRVVSKVGIRKKWSDSDNTTQQLALYRLIGTDEERRKLSTSYNEVTGKDGKPLVSRINVSVVRNKEDIKK